MTTTTARTTALLVGAAAAVVLGVAVGTPGAAAGSDSSSERDDRSVSAIRNATAKFADVDVALAHGYRPVSHCEQHPTLGGMGFHYLNPELASDGKIVPTRPEVLLYEPTEHGLALVGVEYFVAEQAAGGRAPSVQGRRLDGPMDGHSPEMPRHYDLHLWVWKDNPNGISEAWNPTVSCAGGS